MYTFFHPERNKAALLDLYRVYRDNWALTVEMARREVTERHAGSAFGTVWSLAHPLFLIALYVFIFTVVFGTRIGGTKELPLDYATYILSGLIPWMAFQDLMNKSASVIIGNTNLVKQVVFQLEVLPGKTILSSLLPQMVATGGFLVYVLATAGRFAPTYLLLPVLLFFQVLAMLGVAMLFSAITPFFRDMKEIVQIFTTAGLFLMPVIYLPQWVPAVFKPILYINPFSYMTWCYQDALYFGRFEHWWAWPVFILGSLWLVAVGYRTFQRLKPQFGNVL